MIQITLAIVKKIVDVKKRELDSGGILIEYTPFQKTYKPISKLHVELAAIKQPVNSVKRWFNEIITLHHYDYFNFTCPAQIV